MADLKTYSVEQPVKLDGKITKKGTVNCSEKEAAPLLKSGALKAVGGSDTPPVDAEAFKAAVAKLDPSDEAAWTRKGPDLKALEAAGLKVNAKDRDALWVELQAEQGDQQ